MHPRFTFSFSIGLIAFFAALGAHAQPGFGSVISDAGACAELLRPGSEGHAANAPEAVSEISAYLEMNDEGKTASLLDQLRTITDKLVSQNKITRAQAETVFADRVLGDFGTIFLKYAIAELRDRDFNEDQIIKFIFYFEDAYSADTRVEFALAVARRMLVTVSDGSSLSSGAGIDQFTEMYRDLGVDPKSWARFGNVWEAIRTEHLPTIVHFILTNLYRTGERVHAEVEAQIEANRPPPEKPISMWNAFWPRDSLLDVPPSPDQLARDYLGGLRIPQFMTDINCLKLERAAPPDLLTKACKAEATFDITRFIQRLETSPQYGREYLLGEQLDHMTAPQLETLKKWRGFQRLSTELRDRVESTAVRLAEVRRLSEAIGVELIRLRQMDSVAVGKFPKFKNFEQAVTWLASDLLGQRSRWGQKIHEELAVEMSRNFLRIRDIFPRMTNQDFMTFCRIVIRDTFPRGDGEMAVAITKVLMVLSREFRMEPGEVNALLDLMQQYPLEEVRFEGLRPIRDFDNVDWLMNPANWGGVDAENKGILDRLPDLVAKLRTILPPDESDAIFDDAFYPDVAPSRGE